jgi:undecaprenyl pyrophosphate phosphatase UppP
MRLTFVRLLAHVVIHFPRFLSAVMFMGYIIFLEWTHWDAPESETFEAVRQFGAVVVVLLVGFATVFSKFLEQPVKEQEVSHDEGDVELTTVTPQSHMPK